MSRKTAVEVSEDADGRVGAVGTDSGATGEGDSVPAALVALAKNLAAVREDVAAFGTTNSTDRPISNPNPSPRSAEFFELGRPVRQRFDEEGVTEADVDEAIERARSE